MISLFGRESDLGGGLLVRRMLPDRKKRMVGPFCFLDHMGPVVAEPNQDTDVGPHPHIGLSTLTYLFSGRNIHRDSLGTEAMIEPGDVNWMTAGKGISHSERSHPEDRLKRRSLEGLQFWVALPDHLEDVDPSFQHYDSKQIPTQETEESVVRVVAGDGFGLRSPVVTTSDLVLIVIEAKKEFEFEFQSLGFELAVYLTEGTATVSEEPLLANQMFVFEDGKIPKTKVVANSRVIILGGKPFAAPKNIWWNLVSSSKEKIEEAKKAWKSGTFPMIPGETDRIPLPE